MIYHPERLRLQSDGWRLTSGANTRWPRCMAPAGTRNFNFVREVGERMGYIPWARKCIGWCNFTKIWMKRKMLDTMLQMISCIEWFQWAAIFTHCFCTVGTEFRVSRSLNFCILILPIKIHGIRLYSVGSDTWGRNDGLWGWILIYGLIGYEEEVAVTKRSVKQNVGMRKLLP